jgi:hypothetical protein
MLLTQRRTLQQMRYYATLGTDTVHLSPVLGAFQSDSILTPYLTAALLMGIAPLEDVPDDKRDWHPGSNGQVLDLVHPSLYPLIYGTSRRVPLNAEPPPGTKSWATFIGTGDIIPKPPNHPQTTFEEEGLRSTQYQWLPSDVSVAADGGTKFESYINNLHPDTHENLYKALQMLLTASVPLIEATLAQSVTDDDIAIQVDPYSLHDGSSMYHIPSDLSHDLSESALQDWMENRVVTPPRVPDEYSPPSPPAAAPQLCGRKLQVIVKLAEIVLTPEKPDYLGGSWHVEGMANEHIVATVIAYLHSSNITDSKLAFRYAVDDFTYEQGDDKGVREVYGLNDGDPLNQSAGSVLCKAGRVVCFPNTMQHCVLPFSLKDSAVAGVRKIAVLFIVNPMVEILSTRVVPPQQRSWWRKESLLHMKFPPEVVAMIEAHLDFPLLREAAEAHRVALMEERSAGLTRVNGLVYEQEFSLCEH